MSDWHPINIAVRFLKDIYCLDVRGFPNKKVG